MSTVFCEKNGSEIDSACCTWCPSLNIEEGSCSYSEEETVPDENSEGEEEVRFCKLDGVYIKSVSCLSCLWYDHLVKRCAYTLNSYTGARRTRLRRWRRPRGRLPRGSRRFSSKNSAEKISLEEKPRHQEETEDELIPGGSEPAEGWKLPDIPAIRSTGIDLGQEDADIPVPTSMDADLEQEENDVPGLLDSLESSIENKVEEGPPDMLSMLESIENNTGSLSQTPDEAAKPPGLFPPDTLNMGGIAEPGTNAFDILSHDPIDPVKSPMEKAEWWMLNPLEEPPECL